MRYAILVAGPLDPEYHVIPDPEGPGYRTLQHFAFDLLYLSRYILRLKNSFPKVVPRRMTKGSDILPLYTQCFIEIQGYTCSRVIPLAHVGHRREG